MHPDTRSKNWAPVIALVNDGVCALSLLFAVGSPELAAFTPRVWAAGEPGAAVELCWQTWDISQGWQFVLPATAAVIVDTGIDPAGAASAAVTPLILPFTDHPGQMLLFAERTYLQSGSVIRVRSNPVLITLYNG